MKLCPSCRVRPLGLILGALTLSALTLSAHPAGFDGTQARATSAGQEGASQGPVIPADTVIAIRTIDLIDSSGSASDREYKATVDDSVVVDGVTMAPVGTPAFLRVVQVQQAGAVNGRASVSVRLSALEINGQRVGVQTGDATIRSSSQGKKSTKAGVGGALAGGILGGLLGGKGGAAQGAAAGAAVGVTAAAISGQKVHVPAETRLSFTVTGHPEAVRKPASER
jgi:hypothetical protein